jgi:hypothetical protein
MVPPVVEVVAVVDDKWGDPPMPRDHQLLAPWTQQLLRIARSGKVGTKRKANTHTAGAEKPEETTQEASKIACDDRGYLAKKWKPVPEQELAPEHKHFEFLAKRRKGLPSLGTELQGVPIATRKTKVQKASADGSITVYDVLLPVGQSIEGEITDPDLLADVVPVFAPAGTVIEGVGVANEAGIIVVEALNSAPRRNRPPPKKKGGPGRGKKRVTFTNPDGSTYTTIVPNATKIVPQPGQTVKHVAKGEEAGDDVSAEQAAAIAAKVRTDGNEDGDDDDGSGDDDGDEDGEDGEDGEEGDDDGDDDREEGELSDDDAPSAKTATPAAVESRSAIQDYANLSSTGVSTTLKNGGPTSAPSNRNIQEDTEMSEAPMEQIDDHETPNENADESLMDEDMYSPEMLPEIPTDEPEPISEAMPDSIAGVVPESTSEPVMDTAAERAPAEPVTAPTEIDVPVLVAPPDVVAIEVTIDEPNVQPAEAAIEPEAQVSAPVTDALNANEVLPEQAAVVAAEGDDGVAEQAVPEQAETAYPLSGESAEASAQNTEEQAQESSKEELQVPEPAVEPLVESPADPIVTPLADVSVKSSAETPIELTAEPIVESPAAPAEEQTSPEVIPEQTLSEETTAAPLPADIPPPTAASATEAATEPSTEVPTEVSTEAIAAPIVAPEPMEETGNPETADAVPSATVSPTGSQEVHAEAEEDLLGDLEKHLGE